MTAHKHAEMIKAKADNMELVVFRKHHDGDWIEVADQSEIRIKQSGEYFLCLPQHKEACLHWLNGGKVQNNITIGLPSDSWIPFCDFDSDACEPWSAHCNFMRKESNFRIKPRKEKRWVVVDEKGKAVPTLIKDEDSLDNAKQMMSECSFHEIEVEI